jgi:saccharopine dehydrogenase-like NADP-dependent oxidoreductase
MPDCGLSPGLSNLVIGRIGGRPRDVEIRVGGIAADRRQDYVITWSVDDLIEEFVRPARIVRGGRRVTVEACSGVELVKVPGAGELEAFYTDGLRTLLDTCPARDMAEKTMRWPGHIARMVALREMGLFEPRRRALAADVLRACYTADPPKDLVVLDVQVDKRRATMVSRWRDGLTAMARTTALTCAVTARLVADGWKGAGVLPLERVGTDAKAYEFMRRELAKRGVRWTLK